MLKSWLPSSFQKARDWVGKWGLEVKDTKEIKNNYNVSSKKNVSTTNFGRFFTKNKQFPSNQSNWFSFSVSFQTINHHATHNIINIAKKKKTYKVGLSFLLMTLTKLFFYIHFSLSICSSIHSKIYSTVTTIIIEISNPFRVIHN